VVVNFLCNILLDPSAKTGIEMSAHEQEAYFATGVFVYARTTPLHPELLTLCSSCMPRPRQVKAEHTVACWYDNTPGSLLSRLCYVCMYASVREAYRAQKKIKTNYPWQVGVKFKMVATKCYTIYYRVKKPPHLQPVSKKTWIKRQVLSLPIYITVYYGVYFLVR
jgi:hypothetical protein